MPFKALESLPPYYSDAISEESEMFILYTGHQGLTTIRDSNLETRTLYVLLKTRNRKLFLKQLVICTGKIIHERNGTYVLKVFLWFLS